MCLILKGDILVIKKATRNIPVIKLLDRSVLAYAPGKYFYSTPYRCQEIKFNDDGIATERSIKNRGVIFTGTFGLDHNYPFVVRLTGTDLEPEVEIKDDLSEKISKVPYLRKTKNEVRYRCHGIGCSIDQGIHSYKLFSTRSERYVSDTVNPCCLRKVCIAYIPKGAYYIEGNCSDIVSSELVIINPEKKVIEPKAYLIAMFERASLNRFFRSDEPLSDLAIKGGYRLEMFFRRAYRRYRKYRIRDTTYKSYREFRNALYA